MGNTLPKIVGFDLEYLKYSDFESNIDIKFNDNKLLNIDYVRMSKNTKDKIELSQSAYDTLIDILNKIYKEHTKLVMLGYEYPIYTITCIKDIEVSLNRFSGKGNKLRVYEVKSFVSEIRFSNYKCELKELVLKHKTSLYILGVDKNIPITGIENAVISSSGAIKCVDYNLKRLNTDVLRLKYLDEPLPDNRKLREVTELVLEDTCNITDIPIEMIKNIPNLSKITLCKSVKNLLGLEINREKNIHKILMARMYKLCQETNAETLVNDLEKAYLRKDSNGSNYLLVRYDSTESSARDRIIWIDYNY